MAVVAAGGMTADPDTESAWTLLFQGRALRASGTPFSLAIQRLLRHLMSAGVIVLGAKMGAEHEGNWRLDCDGRQMTCRLKLQTR